MKLWCFKINTKMVKYEEWLITKMQNKTPGLYLPFMFKLSFKFTKLNKLELF